MPETTCIYSLPNCRIFDRIGISRMLQSIAAPPALRLFRLPTPMIVDVSVSIAGRDCVWFILVLCQSRKCRRWYKLVCDPSWSTEVNGVGIFTRNGVVTVKPSYVASNVCTYKTIAELYADGNAYNLVSGTGNTRYFFEENIEIEAIPTDTVISQGGGNGTVCVPVNCKYTVSVSVQEFH